MQPDLLDHPDQPVLMDLPDQQDLRGQQDRPDQAEQTGLMVLQDQQDQQQGLERLLRPQDLLGLRLRGQTPQRFSHSQYPLVLRVLQVQQVEQGRPALQDQRGPMALPDLQEQPLDSALLQQAPVLSV